MSRAFSAVVGWCVMAVSCAPAKPSTRAETPEEAALLESCAETERVPFEGSSRLDGALRNAMMMWRMDVCLARSGRYPLLTPSSVDARRVSVWVTTTTELATLVGAGLNAWFNNSGVVSGVIAFRDLERLAGLPEVSAVAMVPEVQPN